MSKEKILTPSSLAIFQNNCPTKEENESFPSCTAPYRKKYVDINGKAKQSFWKKNSLNINDEATAQKSPKDDIVEASEKKDAKDDDNEDIFVFEP